MRYLYILLLIPFFFACSNERKKEMDNITAIRSKLYANEVSRNDKGMALRLDSAYKGFTNKYVKDTMSAVYLYADAQLQQNLLKNMDQANELYRQLVTRFPDHKLAPDALFAIAFNYENMGELGLAKKHYQLFLEKYPKSDLADDAKFSLDNMGKSLEDVVKQFEKQDSLNSAKGKNP